MPIDVIMPQMGESIAEGTLTVWLKKEGERVERDENLFEISTDKVDAEIPSPASGTLGKILVHEGETVDVGTIVAQILAEGETLPEGVAAAEETRPAAIEEEQVEKAREAAHPAEAQADGATVSRGQPAPTPAGTESAVASGGDGREMGERKGGTRIPTKAELRKSRSSPLVRNIAAEHGIDVSTVVGTGLSGRVTKRDILAYVEQAAPGPEAGGEAPELLEAGRVPGMAAEPAGAPKSAEPAARAPAGPAAPQAPTPRPFTDQDRVEIEAMSVMRRRIAEHMIESQRTSAHVTSFFEIDMTRVAELRERNKARFLEDSGVKLTYMPFIISALAAALKEWPILNASVWGDKIVYKKDINVGVAVALPQEKGFGLIVPVIRHADGLSLVGLARAANDLADRARTKKLSPEEVQGGTITITNPGVFGSMAGTPIINQPQVAILGVGAIEKRVKVIGPGDSIGVRTCAYFSISYDHRVVDGATADHFMLVIKDKLENFSDPSLK